MLFWLAVAVCAGCDNGASPASSPAAKPTAIPAAAPISEEAAAGDGAIRFLEDRVKKDPDDFIALNKLGGYYQLKLRETGNLQWLTLAKHTAEASLKAIPAEQNTGGLTLLAQAEFAEHNFAAARDHAKRLLELDGRKAYPYQILGDALLELGDYDGADKAFYEMEQRGRLAYSTETRLGRLAMLRGKDAQAKTHFTNALLLALEMVPKQRETVAWTRWQLGELAFNAGNYAEAEKHYRDALVTFPDYYRALAGLGRARAAQGDLNAAIEHYERATKILPDPSFVAALGDLYELAGRKPEANAQFALCEKLAALGNVYDRQLALFYADHDLKPEEAYKIAKREYEARQDIYGADALAWAALKAGKPDEARQLSKAALRLGTQDPRLLYHAGMIARASGDKNAARDLLQRALKLNPQFDPRHAPIAKQALAD
ncbi:MAG TPA: tetratricopeptide repeat protein [Blastocatellia bacterium]|nr:tetratricopeptide repeat protein [Blastocatellia bacterium]HMX28986.1 tetratricopeptide repeat protein [Blastocatellia bacterium]HNG34550.1 tetratricopeptide repeat protein [Blastocatellia bacterium]